MTMPTLTISDQPHAAGEDADGTFRFFSAFSATDGDTTGAFSTLSFSFAFSPGGQGTGAMPSAFFSTTISLLYEIPTCLRA